MSIHKLAITRGQIAEKSVLSSADFNVLAFEAVIMDRIGRSKLSQQINNSRRIGLKKSLILIVDIPQRIEDLFRENTQLIVTKRRVIEQLSDVFNVTIGFNRL